MMSDFKWESPGQRQQREWDIHHAENILVALDQKLDSEREARRTADAEQMKMTIRWNKINLAVGISGVAVGLAGVIVAVVALFLK